MKNFKMLSVVFIILLTGIGAYAQVGLDKVAVCIGYPKDETCCQNHKGTWVVTDSQSFCYLNLLRSPVNKSDCMNAGGYAYWRNDSLMLCIPKGVLFVSGKVADIYNETMTIVVISEGDTYNISSENEITLPDRGDLIDIYYTVDETGKLRIRNFSLMETVRE